MRMFCSLHTNLKRITCRIILNGKLIMLFFTEKSKHWNNGNWSGKFLDNVKISCSQICCIDFVLSGLRCGNLWTDEMTISTQPSLSHSVSLQNEQHGLASLCQILHHY
jgi:hypothetical protein